jgi:ribosomal protein RSM22 (predicted rRNA methylase)
MRTRQNRGAYSASTVKRARRTKADAQTYSASTVKRARAKQLEILKVAEDSEREMLLAFAGEWAQ